MEKINGDLLTSYNSGGATQQGMIKGSGSEGRQRFAFLGEHPEPYEEVNTEIRNGSCAEPNVLFHTAPCG